MFSVGKISGVFLIVREKAIGDKKKKAGEDSGPELS